MMEFTVGKKVEPRLNIAPLIDVVFLLLIFFMLSSHFVTQPGIKIILPEAMTAKLHPDEDIIISITKDNILYLNEEQITLDNLFHRLSIKLREAKKSTIIIRADEKIDLGLAVKVMDVAKQLDVEGLVLSTRIEENDK